MYYSSEQEQELGFDAFIAPDDFNRTAQPVDIYEVFKREYALNSQARYIYYYSDGNYPLTLTPTADEYYKYGYTQGGIEIVVDVALNAAPVTIFGEILTSKRWVIVYRVSTAKFTVYLEDFKGSLWIYVGPKIDVVRNQRTHNYNTTGLITKYIHYSNINSFEGKTSSLNLALNNTDSRLSGRLTFPETILNIGNDSYGDLINVFYVTFPSTKDVYINLTADIYGALGNNIIEINFGASTSLSTPFSSVQLYFSNISRISVSPQNTAYASFPMCDIIYTKDLTVLHWLAPKTVRGLTLPDQLPQAQITALGTKFRLQQLQGYPLYIGTQITDLTNLYLSNKSFTTIAVGAGNTAFSVENGMLRTATNLIKACTDNTGYLIIPNVQTIEAGCFLRCTGYTGNLTIPNTVTSIAAGAFFGLTNLTSLTLPVGYDCAIYNNFGFANFSADSLNTAILNLANGTVGAPKYFYISKTSLDALNVAYPNAVSDAAARYINVKAGIVQDSSLKLWLDAGNTFSYPGSGTVWNDLSGNGNNGTLVNGVAYSTANGGMMIFDGANDYVNCGKVSQIENIGAMSISVWIYRTANTLDYFYFIAGKAEYQSPYKETFGLYIRNNKAKFESSSDSYLAAESITVLNVNTWYNVVGTYSGSSTKQRKIYINGVLENTVVNTVDPILFTADLSLGMMGTTGTAKGNYFKGFLNEPLVFNKELTADEIFKNFNETRSKYRI